MEMRCWFLFFVFSVVNGENCRGEAPKPRDCDRICDANNNCKIRAALLLPRNTTYDACIAAVEPVFELAMLDQAVRKAFPPWIEFEWLTYDVTDCDAAYAVISAIDAYNDCTNVFFGPSCDFALASVARITKFLGATGIPLVTTGGFTFDFVRPKRTCKDEFYMMVRAGPMGFEDLAFFIIDLMGHYGWRQLLLINEPEAQIHVAGKSTCLLMMKSFANFLKKEDIIYTPWDTTSSAGLNYTENLKFYLGYKYTNASIKSMAAVIYWRLTRSDGKVLVCFAAAKSKVTPLRPVSIPRLELNGGLIATRLADTLQREHKDIKPDKRYFWTDSHTVLQWIRSDPRSFKPFVAFRLGEIDELTMTSEWRYVPSKLNVADLATKEDSPPLVYESTWYQGPGFLRQPEDTWPKDLKPRKTTEEAVCELRSVHVMTSEVIDSSLPDENRFSSWIRLVRATARVLLFIKRCRRTEAQFNVELMNEAEKLLLKKCQQDSFAQDIDILKQNKPLHSTSRLLTLTPYIDSDGILRVHGRVDKIQNVDRSTMRPAILDGRHKITRLLVEYYHRKALHGAHELVVNELRQRYWILKLRPTVRAVASSCLFCRHRRAAPLPQRMADLPAARLQHNRKPFSFTGIDFFGPMEVTVGRRREKRYGVLFTCLTIRAIHIEVAESLSLDSTIMALRRMIARRATPVVIYSDNGTNFHGADNELKRSLLELNQSRLHEDGQLRGIEWRYIPPGAPEMGGAWERQIRTVKTALKVVLKERAPRPETLSTFLTEVEALVNSRPITYVSCDPNYPEALTPNHFLIGTSSNGPVVGTFDNSDLCLRKQWRIAQHLTDMFWTRWVKEYLPTLLPRHKWNRDQRALREGDFVLLIEPNLDRGSWRHGVVSRTLCGDDGRARVLDVRTRTGVVRRPATRVALLSPAECSADLNC